MDSCGLAANSTYLKFYYFIGSSSISSISCDNKTVPGASESDDSWWNIASNTVATSNNKFLCAKSLSGSYIVSIIISLVLIKEKILL